MCEFYDSNPAARFLPREPTGNLTHKWESQRLPGDPNRLTLWEDRVEHMGAKSSYKGPTAKQLATAAATAAAEGPLQFVGKSINKARDKLTSRWDANNSKRVAGQAIARGARKVKLAAPVTSSLVIAWAGAHDFTERGDRARQQVELTKAAAAGTADDDYA